MNTQTMLVIVRALIAADQTDEQIAATLEQAGFVVGEADADAAGDMEALAEQTTTEAPPAPTRKPGRQTGVAPSVKYRLVAGMTANRIAQRLTGRPLQIASVILKHNGTTDANGGITKRAILEAIAKADPDVTNAAIMSGIHALQQREIVRSVPLDKTAKPVGKPRAVPSAGRVR